MQRKNPAVRELNRVSTASRNSPARFKSGSVLVATVSSNGTSRTGTRQRAKPRLTAAWRRALKLQARTGHDSRAQAATAISGETDPGSEGGQAAIAAARRMAN